MQPARAVAKVLLLQDDFGGVVGHQLPLVVVVRGAAAHGARHRPDDGTAADAERNGVEVERGKFIGHIGTNAEVGFLGRVKGDGSAGFELGALGSRQGGGTCRTGQ